MRVKAHACYHDSLCAVLRYDTNTFYLESVWTTFLEKHKYPWKHTYPTLINIPRGNKPTVDNWYRKAQNLKENMACHLRKRTTTKKGKFKDLVRKKKLLLKKEGELKDFF